VGSVHCSGLPLATSKALPDAPRGANGE